MAEHLHFIANILQHTRDIVTNEHCKVKLKIQPPPKESLIFISLWTETARGIYSGRGPDGPHVQSKSAASIVVFSSEHPGNKMQLTTL